MADYSIFDRPEIVSFLFHPRKENASPDSEQYRELLVPVDGGIVIGARLYESSKQAPVLLFFHGNGEIVDDYSDLGPLYNNMGLNFLPVDYRGYGKSTGNPTVSSMMSDCHDILDFVRQWLADNGFIGKLILVGRSLGSASVLELASSYPDIINGLVVESGFAFIVPLMKLLGVNTRSLGIREESGFNNIEKIKKFSGPTLVIHAEYDHIIPFSDGKALYDASPDKGKRMLRVPKANHNTIFMYGLREYMDAVKKLSERVLKKG